MSWGSSPKVEVTASSASNSRQLIPLIIAAIIVSAVAVVGYQIYVGVAKIRNNAEKRMARHNMVFTKDGMRVGVRHIEQENYVDQTQSWVVKAWNLGESSSTVDSEAIKRKKLAKSKDKKGAK